LLLSATLALAQNVVIGVTVPGTTVDGQNGNALLGQSVTLTQPAVLQSQSMKIINPAGQLVMGIYDASGPNGSPGQLLAQTVGFTPVAGVNTQPYTTPVFAAPANYWLIYSPSDNALSYDIQTVAGEPSFAYAGPIAWSAVLPSAFPTDLNPTAIPDCANAGCGWPCPPAWTIYATGIPATPLPAGNYILPNGSSVTVP
jgi:hypothetical protein